MHANISSIHSVICCAGLSICLVVLTPACACQAVTDEWDACSYEALIEVDPMVTALLATFVAVLPWRWTEALATAMTGYYTLGPVAPGDILSNVDSECKSPTISNVESLFAAHSHLL